MVGENIETKKKSEWEANEIVKLTYLDGIFHFFRRRDERLVESENEKDLIGDWKQHRRGRRSDDRRKARARKRD